MSAANTVLSFIKENYSRNEWINFSALQNSIKMDSDILDRALEILDSGNHIEIDETYIEPKIRWI